MNTAKITIVFLLSLLIFGCGFHLRGQDPSADYQGLESQSIFLASAIHQGKLFTQLRMDLQLAKAELINDAKKAKWHLILLSNKLTKRVVGFDKNGRANEYEMSLQVEYIINPAKWDKSGAVQGNERNKKVVSNQTNLINDNEIELKQRLMVNRNFYFDNQKLIGQRSEEKAILESINQQASKQLINQLLIKINHD